jgi:alkylation response protein AidB-like acyl-CoA dehydrogenase
LHPISTVLSGLVDASTSAAHADLIESLISGQTVASWAVYEPGRPWAPLTPGVTATRADGGYRLDGVKDRVEAGGDASVLLVVAALDGQPLQFLVDTDATGVTVEAQQSIDLVKRFARVQFDDVQVADDAVVGTVETTAALIARQSQIAQILQCAEVVGVLDAVFDMTTQWALDRHSFGRPLASYQALKHKFADMKIWLETSRATARAAVTAVANRSADAELCASVAKSYIGEHAPGMLQLCVQLHGGIGVTWEHDLHLFLRRVSLYRSLFGTPEEHNLRVYAITKALEAAS